MKKVIFPMLALMLVLSSVGCSLNEADGRITSPPSSGTETDNRGNMEERLETDSRYGVNYDYDDEQRTDGETNGNGTARHNDDSLHDEMEDLNKTFGVDSGADDGIV